MVDKRLFFVLTRSKAITLILLLCLIVQIDGCGFRLRQQRPLQEKYQPVFIDVPAKYKEVSSILERQLLSYDTKITGKLADAKSILRIIEEEQTTTPITIVDNLIKEELFTLKWQHEFIIITPGEEQKNTSLYGNQITEEQKNIAIDSNSVDTASNTTNQVLQEVRQKLAKKVTLIVQKSSK